MKLYLVRHASAVERLGGTILRDADRPLIDEGKQEAESMAHALGRMGVKGDAFLASPLVRARQTGQIFADVLGRGSKLEITETLAPGADVPSLYKRLSRLSNAEEVFLFGHMPDVSFVVSALLGAEELDIPFKKAAVCRVDVYDMPPTRPDTLKWFITPRLVEVFDS